MEKIKVTIQVGDEEASMTLNSSLSMKDLINKVLNEEQVKIVNNNEGLPSLADLIKKYNSDKFTHGYTHVYESVFKNIRHNPINFLEIGIGTMIPNVHSTMVHVFGENGNYKPGASLRAFRDYFINGKIYGVDVQKDCVINDEDRICTYLFDSTIKTNCENTLKDLRFDIIIDDGDHTDTSQEATFRNLWPFLKKGGYYFIEDVSDYGRESFFYKWTERLGDILTEQKCVFWDKSHTPWNDGPKLLAIVKI